MVNAWSRVYGDSRDLLEKEVIRRHFSNPIHQEWRPAVYFGHGVMKNLVHGLQSEGVN